MMLELRKGKQSDRKTHEIFADAENLSKLFVPDKSAEEEAEESDIFRRPRRLRKKGPC